MTLAMGIFQTQIASPPPAPTSSSAMTISENPKFQEAIKRKSKGHGNGNGHGKAKGNPHKDKHGDHDDDRRLVAKWEGNKDHDWDHNKFNESFVKSKFNELFVFIH